MDWNNVRAKVKALTVLASLLHALREQDLPGFRMEKIREPSCRRPVFEPSAAPLLKHRCGLGRCEA